MVWLVLDMTNYPIAAFYNEAEAKAFAKGRIVLRLDIK